MSYLFNQINYKKLLIASNFINHWRFLPTNYTGQDVFLVSFPRSGSTWFRFLIANAIKTYYGIEEEVNFFTLHNLIPDIQSSRRIHKNSPFSLPNLPRIIKSHSSYNPYYKRVIFLARNPTDVLTSYYFYLISKRKIPQDFRFSDFVKHNYYGIKAWKKHTDSWLNYYNHQNIQIVKYEDLSTKTLETVQNVMNLFGLNISQENLQRAIILSSKDEMRILEKSTISTLVVKNQLYPFISKNHHIDKIELTDQDQKYIQDNTVFARKILNYK